MLELKDICYTLPDGKEILKHIDLTVRDNEFMVITGPNGGGKSTLAKLIAGIVTPTSGQILLDAVQKYFKERVFKSCQETKFVLASLGNDAGMYGCAKMIFNA